MTYVVFVLGFHFGLMLSWNVSNKIQPPPGARLRRMERMFAKSGGILVEDYQYFTKHSLPDASTLQNKAVRKSETVRALRVPRPS